MKRISTLTILPLVVALCGCGQSERAGAGNIVTTNTGNIVLNDAQGNYAFRGDNEQAVGQPDATDAAGPTNASLSGNVQ